jgi:tetratricopeptide (TPR) repeat protein
MRALGVAALGAGLALAVSPVMIRDARKFPPLSELPSTPYSVQDAAMAAAGLRAAAADLAWIELLQYSAGGLTEMPDRPGADFEHIKPLTQRVVRLDPSFSRAYLYGAGVLGWFKNLQRYDDAVELLEEGIRNDPGQPLYAEYIAALAYQKRGDTGKMLEILEPLAENPRSPVVMREILANLYKTKGEFSRSLAIWESILDDDSQASERPRARLQINEIHALMKAQRPAAKPASK